MLTSSSAAPLQTSRVSEHPRSEHPRSSDQPSEVSVAPPPDEQSVRRRFRLAVLLWAAFCLSMAGVNWLAAQSGGDDESPMMHAAGLALVLFVFPVLCIGLPLRLGRRWRLTRRWLPPKGHGAVAITATLVYTMLAGFGPLMTLDSFDPKRFAIHFLSAALFHVPYYALFAGFLLPAARAAHGPVRAVALVAAGFALFHLSTFYFFPAGTRPLFLFGLFVVFVGDLLLYLYTRSLLLTALSHAVTGALGLASQGTYFDQVDFVFVFANLIVGGLVTFGLFEARRREQTPDPDPGFWLRVSIGEGA